MNKFFNPKDQYPWSSFLIWSRVIQIILYLFFSILVAIYIVLTSHMLTINNSSIHIGFADIIFTSVSNTPIEQIGIELIAEFGQIGFIFITLIIFVLIYLLIGNILGSVHLFVQQRVFSDLGVDKVLLENQFLKIKWSFLNHSFLIFNTLKGTKVRSEIGNLFWRIKYELIE